MKSSGKEGLLNHFKSPRIHPWGFLTGLDQSECLFERVILAWFIGLRVGMWLQVQVPVKIKGRGRSAMTLVKYGAARRWGGDCPGDPNGSGC